MNARNEINAINRAENHEISKLHSMQAAVEEAGGIQLKKLVH